jgi:hypothetical protein
MASKQKRAAETWRYVLFADRALPPEQQSTFVLRPLTQLERADVHDNMTRFVSVPEGGRVAVARDHRLSVELCASNIVAVENFPAGAAEPWPEGRAERFAYLEGLDDAYVQEIGNELWLRATLGDDAKNSLPPRPMSTSDGALAANTSTTALPATPTPP